ncbi:MAG: acetylglutamate kinase [Ignavibacteriales bacterium]|nr:acetylglutamate kinase [Ignavibacteriales bacterium]
MSIAILKISGKSLEEFTNNFAGVNLIKSLQAKYTSVILIHGGGNLITQWAEKMGIKSEFFEGQRVTCKETMEITAAVQGGLINGRINAYLHKNGIKAIGLNGIDMDSFVAEYVNDKLGFVGNPISISDKKWLFDLLNDNIVPVFSSLCRDKDGNLMNVNADLFAGALAKALKADSVFFISDVQGVKLNNEFQNSLSTTQLKEGMDSGEINNGMIPKINACLNLLASGIKNIWIGNEMTDNNLRGTWIVN